MSFLQPFLLWGLALATIPIIIHLIHQRRFRTLDWGAMYFLRQAKQQAKGMARLKQWLILAMRTLALLALAFAISRPLSGGWVGKAGAGNLPLAIVLLDRSPSMEQNVGKDNSTKREAGLRKIVEACEKLKPNRMVLIENINMAPLEFSEPSDLYTLPETGPADDKTHWPSMLQKAMEYISVNKPGNCQIWICSDLKENDWDLNNGLWASIKKEFPNINDNIQILLLPMTQSSPSNMGVHVTNAERIISDKSSQVQLDFKITQFGEELKDAEIPIDINVNGSTSRSKIQVTGRESVIEGFAIDIDPGQTNGWGWVKIPSDNLASDDSSYFSYSPFKTSKTLLTNKNADSNGPLVWISESSPDGSAENFVQVTTIQDFSSLNINDVSLIIWDNPIPEDSEIKNKLLQYVGDGGQLLVIASEVDTDAKIAGVSFSDIISAPQEEFFKIDNWKTEEDLLARSFDGTPLPVGELRIKQYRKLEHAGQLPISLARFETGAPLLSKINVNNGFIYFLTTHLNSAWSDLGSNGIVLYVMVQRALAQGVAAKKGQNFREAGEAKQSVASQWIRIAGNKEAPSTENASIAGVYKLSNGEFLAVNRSLTEVSSPALSIDSVKEGFGELPLQVIGSGAEEAESGIVQEVWRLFLLLMVAALMLEAFFSLPTKRNDSSNFPGRAA